MVKERLDIQDQPEVLSIFEHIDNGHNFLLSGGAGSGKTYSLVSVIRQVIKENPNIKIACMTYTNSAVKEIEDRVNHKNLKVSTIHDFLWDNIKNFQSELKSTLIYLAKEESITRIVINNPEEVLSGDIKIQYKEYIRLREGIISHDEVLTISEHMFAKYPKLCDILKDKFKFIFIDEYQDTNEQVIRIFLDHLRVSKKESIIGLFGDAMQSIYDDGIGNLNSYLEEDYVKEVVKNQNRRNPKKIYELANKLRTDSVKQEHSSDLSAPNILPDGNVKDGNILFLYSVEKDTQKIKDYLKKLDQGWDFDNSKTTKELNLTHNLISAQAGFSTLMEIYGRDRIIEYKNKILKELKEKTDIIIEDSDTFGNVIEKIQTSKTPVITQFIESNPLLYEKAKKYPFEIFKKIYIDTDILTDDKKQNEDEENTKGSKRDNLVKHLFKIQNILRFYVDKNFPEFFRVMKRNGICITTIEDKRKFKSNIENLLTNQNTTIGEVINKADELEIVKKDDKINEFINSSEYIYDRIKEVSYQEFIKLYNYLEGLTPFSTQHKTKGNEFDNVLVILDNGNWVKYNFNYLFTNRTDKASVLERTQKLFYVCCTRSKENLAVFFQNPSPQVIETAKNWFEEIIDLDKL
ncbi:UvrD-helicase domain-containing protein [Chryseobacterium indoltheticum]|uniref:ATP-dependent DNA helicase pcrA n=1 Tax=Chryseobacterium indoltheticum TaxID=254 RepID=A0A381FH00_9FLAO|nr:UvrD-helicase domain-containing protein [Chryseobacterium indoltheticum]SUX45845.1 ATP-dependent DNA helicase pcrA [Chryseobacterium indoltheticum]